MIHCRRVSCSPARDETTGHDWALSNYEYLSGRRLQRRQYQKAALKIGRITDRGHVNIYPGSGLRKWRKIRGYQHGSGVANLHRRR